MTVARFSLQAALPYMAVGLGMAFAFFFGAWLHPPSVSDFTFIHGSGGWDAFGILGLALSPFIVWMQLLIVWQLIFNGCRAARIADSELHYMNIYGSVFFSRVSVSEIDRLSLLPATAFKSSAVVLHLKDGRVKYIPAFLLTETAEPVAARLSGLLA